MKRKKDRKPDKQATGNKIPTKTIKEQTGVLPKISYIYSVILTLITLYSWFPTFSIEPQVMYFDGDHDTLQFVVKNNSLIPANLIKTTIDLKSLKIDGSNFTNIKQTIHDGNLLHTNKPRTIPFKVFQIGLQPIREVKESNLKFVISYKIPFLPIPFNEEHDFSAIKDSKASIKWLHK